MKKTRAVFFVCSLLQSLCWMPGGAKAQTEASLGSPTSTKSNLIPPGEETFLFHLGYFLPSFKTVIQLNNDRLGVGDSVNVEDKLGIDKQENVLWGDVFWRMTPRNRLSLGYYSFNRKGSRVVEEQLQIGDNIYPVGATLDTNLKFAVVPISYLYSFVKTENMEFSGTIGLQWSYITLKVNGDATLAGSSVDGESRADADGPFPLIGMDLNYFIFPNWSVGGNISAFTFRMSTSVTTYQGSLASANINTDYWFSKYVGAGLALNGFIFDVNASRKSWDGGFQYQYFGPQIYLIGRF